MILQPGPLIFSHRCTRLCWWRVCACLFCVGALAVLAALSPLALADTLFLKNGDVLTGTIRQLTDKSLEFRTPWAGVVKIKLAAVESMESEELLWLRLKGQDNFRLVSLRSRDRKTWLYDQTGQCVPLKKKSQLAFLQAESLDKDFWFWNGELTVSLSLDQGRTRRGGLQTFGHTTVRDSSNRHILRWDMEHVVEKSRTKTREQHVNYDYNHFISQKMYLLGTGQWFYDTDENFRWRASAGAGAGYQLWNTPDSDLKTDVGISHLWEAYRRRDNQKQWALRWGLGYVRSLSDGLVAKFNSSTFYRPKSAAHLLWEMQAGLKYKISSSFSFDLRYQLEQESTGGSGPREPVQKQLTLGVGYSW